MSRRCIEHMLDELELANFSSYHRWYNASQLNPVCYALPNLHTEFRNSMHLNRFDFYASEYYRPPYWLFPNLPFHNYEPFYLMKKNERRNFPTRSFYSDNRKRQNGKEQNFYHYRKPEELNYRNDRINCAGVLPQTERRYMSQWGRSASVQPFKQAQDDRCCSRTSHRSSNSDSNADAKINGQHFSQFRRLFSSSSRQPSPECSVEKEGYTRKEHSSSSHSTLTSLGSRSKPSEDDGKGTNSSSSHLSDVTTHTPSPDFSNGYASWFCNEEQQQIIETLREINMRHERQLRRDILAVQGERPRSDDSSASNNESQSVEVQHRSLSSEDDEDCITLLLSPANVLPNPDATAEEEDAMNCCDYFEKSASDYFEEFQNIFTVSPEKKIINTLTREFLKEKESGKSRDLEKRLFADFTNKENAGDNVTDVLLSPDNPRPKEDFDRNSKSPKNDGAPFPENKYLAVKLSKENDELVHDFKQNTTKSLNIPVHNLEELAQVIFPQAKEMNEITEEKGELVKEIVPQTKVNVSCVNNSFNSLVDQFVDSLMYPLKESNQENKCLNINGRKLQPECPDLNNFNDVISIKNIKNPERFDCETCATINQTSPVGVNKPVKNNNNSVNSKEVTQSRDLKLNDDNESIRFIKTSKFDKLQNIQNKKNMIAFPLCCISDNNENFNNTSAPELYTLNQNFDQKSEITRKMTRVSDTCLVNEHIIEDICPRDTPRCISSLSDTRLNHPNNAQTYKRISLSDIFNSEIRSSEDAYQNPPKNQNYLDSRNYPIQSPPLSLSPSAHLKQILGIGQDRDTLDVIDLKIQTAVSHDKNPQGKMSSPNYIHPDTTKCTGNFQSLRASLHKSPSLTREESQAVSHNDYHLSKYKHENADVKSVEIPIVNNSSTKQTQTSEFGSTDNQKCDSVKDEMVVRPRYSCKNKSYDIEKNSSSSRSTAAKEKDDRIQMKNNSGSADGSVMNLKPKSKNYSMTPRKIMEDQNDKGKQIKSIEVDSKLNKLKQKRKKKKKREVVEGEETNDVRTSNEFQSNSFRNIERNESEKIKVSEKQTSYVNSSKLKHSTVVSKKYNTNTGSDVFQNNNSPDKYRKQLNQTPSPNTSNSIGNQNEVKYFKDSRDDHEKTKCKDCERTSKWEKRGNFYENRLPVPDSSQKSSYLNSKRGTDKFRRYEIDKNNDRTQMPRENKRTKYQMDSNGKLSRDIITKEKVFTPKSSSNFIYQKDIYYGRKLHGKTVEDSFKRDRYAAISSNKHLTRKKVSSNQFSCNSSFSTTESKEKEHSQLRVDIFLGRSSIDAKDMNGDGENDAILDEPSASTKQSDIARKKNLKNTNKFISNFKECCEDKNTELHVKHIDLQHLDYNYRNIVLNLRQKTKDILTEAQQIVHFINKNEPYKTDLIKNKYKTICSCQTFGDGISPSMSVSTNETDTAREQTNDMSSSRRHSNRILKDSSDIQPLGETSSIRRFSRSPSTKQFNEIGEFIERENVNNNLKRNEKYLKISRETHFCKIHQLLRKMKVHVTDKCSGVSINENSMYPDCGKNLSGCIPCSLLASYHQKNKANVIQYETLKSRIPFCSAHSGNVIIPHCEDLRKNLELVLYSKAEENILQAFPILLNALSALIAIHVPLSRENLKNILERNFQNSILAVQKYKAVRKESKKELKRTILKKRYVFDVLEGWDILSNFYVNTVQNA